MMCVLPVGSACRCLDKVPSPLPATGPRPSGLSDAGRKAMFDLQQLRKQRPVEEWLPIYAKRNQLILVRLMRGDPQMCPAPGDAGPTVRPAGSSTIFDAVREVAKEARKKVWDDLAPQQLRASPLHVASFLCQPRAVRLLLDQGSPLEATDDRGLTALHWASCPEVVQMLIEAGANVNASSSDGLTPLHLAVQAPVVKLLIGAGAKADAVDRCGNQPLHLAAWFGLRSWRASSPSTDGATVTVPLSDMPPWLNKLYLLAADVIDQFDRAIASLDVHGALIDAGASTSAQNMAGHVPDEVFPSGGGDDWD